MANSHTYDNPYFLIDGTDLTNYIKRLTVTMEQKVELDNAGAVTADKYSPTIKASRMTSVFQYVLDAGNTERTLWAIYNAGTAVAYSWGPEGSSAGTATPIYSGSAILLTAPFSATVGELVEISVDWQGSGAVSVAVA